MPHGDICSGAIRPLSASGRGAPLDLPRVLPGGPSLVIHCPVPRLLRYPPPVWPPLFYWCCSRGRSDAAFFHVDIRIGNGVGDDLLRHEQAHVFGAPVDHVRAEGEDILVRNLELLLLFSV